MKSLGAVLLVAGCSSGAGHPAASPSATTTATTSTSPAGQASRNAGPPSSPQATTATGANGFPDWPTYHATPDRAGHVAAGPNPTRLHRAWSQQVDGAVYAEPLVVAGQLIVATENNTVYSFDARSGALQWKKHVAAPVPISALPCGNIDPLGITGTPVYDAAHRRILVVAETRVTGTVQHQLVGLALGSGQLQVRRPVDPPNQDPRPMQQRGALALVNGRVYVPFGGLYGDCGDYHGHVVGIAADGTGPLATYRVPTSREGGIWAPPGPVLTRDGRLLVSVGNGESRSSYDGTDSVLALNLPGLARTGVFAPTQWAQDNAADLDLGSMSPALLPDGHVVIAGKRGTVYLLDGAHLGGIGGQLASLEGCRGFGGAAVSGSNVYLPCADGLRAVRVGPGDTLAWSWRAPGVVGSPVVAGTTVWALSSGGVLHAYDAASGRTLGQLSVGRSSRFATPTVSGSFLYVGTLGSVVALTG